MVYTDKCPVLSDIEWRDNCQFPVIRKGETPSDWIKRIWDQLTNYKNNNRLTDDKKRYLIARKMKYLWEGDLGHAVGVSIAICIHVTISFILESEVVMSVGFVISWINIGAQIAQETHIVILVIKTIWNLKVDQKLVTPTLKKMRFVVMNCGCPMLSKKFNMQEKLEKRSEL